MGGSTSRGDGYVLAMAAHTMSRGGQAWRRGQGGHGTNQAWGGGGGGAAIWAAVAYGTSGWKGLNCCWTAFRATGGTARVGVALLACGEDSTDTAHVQRAHAALVDDAAKFATCGSI